MAPQNLHEAAHVTALTKKFHHKSPKLSNTKKGHAKSADLGLTKSPPSVVLQCDQWVASTVQCRTGVYLKSHTEDSS